MSLTPRNSTILKANSNDSTRPDFAASYTVTAYPPGAVVVSVSTTTVTVDAGHGFVAGDKYLANPGTNDTFSGTDDVQSVTATTIVMGQDQSAILSAGDVLVNLGPDTGTSAPNYDGSGATIYSDMDGGTAIPNSRVTCDSEGGYEYFTSGQRLWELVRDSSGSPVAAIKGAVKGVISPSSSTDNGVARFDGTTGEIVQDSGVTVDDSDNVDIPGTLTVDGVSTQTGATTQTGKLTCAGEVEVDGALNHDGSTAGFFDTTPTTQPTALTTQLTTITHTEPGTPDYAIQDLTNSSPYGFVSQDEGNSVLKVIANLQVRVEELESKLQALGLLA